MPKDEFDFEDPLELNRVAFLTQEDTTDAMCECFIEEFMRMGYNPKQILALFRNPNYLGMSMVLEKRCEPFVQTAIAGIFARWGRKVAWPESVGQVSCPSPRSPALEAGLSNSPAQIGKVQESDCETNDLRPIHAPTTSDWTAPLQIQELDASNTDPMGAAIPKLNL